MRRMFRVAAGRDVKKSMRPFTIRLPQETYDRLLARAQANRRSVAAEIELMIEAEL